MLLELLRKRRSIRKYKDEKVKKEDIDKIIKAALLSPSSRGKRPWEIIVVEDREKIEKLSDAKQHGSQFLKEAPLAIVVLGKKEISDVWIEDCSILSTLIQIEAEALGYGSCWVQIRNRMQSEGISSDTYLRDIFNIGEETAVEAVIGIGISNEKKEAYTYDEIDYEKVHYEDYE